MPSSPLITSAPAPAINPMTPQAIATVPPQEASVVETVQPADPAKEDGLFEHGETVHLNKKADQPPKETV